MFPDRTVKWRPYPSIMDGMKAPPDVLDRGVWRGVLSLIVLESTFENPGSRAYRVEVVCEIYAAFDEMIYSIAKHGDGSGMYDGGVYIKEAEDSSLMRTWTKLDPFNRKVHHFSFVGGDLCYETLGSAEPVIYKFSTVDEALAWRRPRRERTPWRLWQRATHSKDPRE